MASGPDVEEDDSGGNSEAANAPGADPKRQWGFLHGRTPGKQRKPPSNPPGWAAGKSSVYDLAKRPNRIVVINGEQVGLRTSTGVIQEVEVLVSSPYVELL